MAGKIIGKVLINLCICIVLLLPNIFVRHSLGLGFYPDSILIAAAAFFISASLLSTIAFRFFAVSALLLNAIYLHVFKTWGGNQLSDRVEVAMESPSYETIEYLRDYLTLGDIKIAGFIFLCLIALLFSRSLLTRYHFLGTVVVIGCALSLLHFCKLNNEKLKGHMFLELGFAYEEAYTRRLKVKGRALAIQNRHRNLNRCSESYENILVVIGESATKNHMGLYGYDKHNTPFLNGLQPLALNAISPANQTRLAIPLILTRARVQNFDEFFEVPSLVTALSDCGYETFWVSNQRSVGKHDSSNTSIAKESQNYFLSNSAGSEPDEVLIPRIESIAKQPGRKAIFVHLMGSHFQYKGRYPESFSAGAKQTMVDEYDESIRYTDHILSQLFKLFPSDNLLFSYVSDHGELAGVPFVKNGLTFHGHGFSPSHKGEYEVPLVLWSADKSRLNTLQDNVLKQQVNTESFYDLMLFLVGINNSPSLSFSHEVLEVSSERVVSYTDLK